MLLLFKNMGLILEKPFPGVKGESGIATNNDKEKNYGLGDMKLATRTGMEELLVIE
jgi:hypothetical protein